MNYFKITLCLGAISLTHILCTSVSKATEAQAEDEARRLARVMEYRLGYNVYSYFNHGSLREKESDMIEKTFYRGVDYLLVAGGCDYARDIDIKVYDEYFNLITEDDDIEKSAAVTFTPSWTGTFYIKITMYESSASNVHWALLYGYR